MSRVRFLLVLVTVGATAARGVQGLAFGLACLAIGELLGLLLGFYDRRAVTRGRVTSALRRSWRWLARHRPSWLFPPRYRGASGFPWFERIVADLPWSRYSRRDFDMRMRKRLLEIASVRLEDHYGIDLDRQPDEARALLGEVAWATLEPWRPVSEDRSAPGVSLAALEETVTALERLTGKSG